MANPATSRTKKNETGRKPPVAPPLSEPEPTLDEGSETGSVEISEGVIVSIVRRYTLEVDGVVRFAPAGIVGGLVEMIGKKSQESNTVVTMEGDGVDISVTLVLRFGVRIPDVAGLVQDVIRSHVEELTGKRVGRVHVLIQDLEEEKPVARKPESSETVEI